MAILVTCRECRRTVAAPEERAGRVVRCGECGELVTVPHGTEPATPTKATRAEPVAPTVRPSRGVILWLLAGLCVLGVLAVSVMGAGVWLIAAPEWQTHNPASGGFRIELPASPKDLVELNRIKPDAGVNVFGTVLYFHREEYGVIWRNHQWVGSGLTDEVVLDREVQNLLSGDPPLRKVSERKVEVNGFPAREVVCDLSGQGTATYRLVLAENRLYTLFVGGPACGPENVRVRRFLDSFEVTDATLLAKLERRRSDEQRRRDEQAAAERAREKQAAEESAAFQAFVSTGQLGRPIPAATDLPGCKLYLPFELTEDGQLIARGENGKEVPFALQPGARLGPGARGQAVFTGKNSRELDLSQFVDALRFDANQPWTVACWVKRKNYPVAFLRASNRHTLDTHFEIASQGDRIRFIHKSWAGIGNAFQMEGPCPHDWAWHHVAVVRTLAGGVQGDRVELYVDGKRAASQNLGRGATTTRLNTMCLADYSVRPTDPAQFVALDEFCIYNRPLTGREVEYLAGLQNDPSTPPEKRAAIPSATEFEGCKFYLPLDDTDGDGVLEKVSGKRVGTRANVNPTDGTRGSAVRIATVPDRGIANPKLARKCGIDLTDAAGALSIPANRPFTLALWVRSPDPLKTNVRLIEARRVGGPPLLFVAASSKETVAFLRLLPSKNAEGAQLAHNAPLPAEQWCHIVLVRDDKGFIRFLIDGQQVGISESPVLGAIPFGSFLLAAGSNDSAFIDLDEFCLFERALTDDELKRLAGVGK